jgi:hypothetical protein
MNPGRIWALAAPPTLGEDSDVYFKLINIANLRINF